VHQLFLSTNYIEFLIVLILLVIAIESFVTLLKDSDLSFELIHKRAIPWYERKSHSFVRFVIFKWLTCGQCMSVFYAIPAALYFSMYYINYELFPFSTFIMLLVLSRLSNWLNSSYKLLHNGRAVAVEFLTPLFHDFVGSDMNDGNDMSALEQAREREFRKGTEEKVIIRTLSDVQQIIKKLINQKPPSGKVVLTTVQGKTLTVDTSTKHPSYMTQIRDGFLEIEEFSKKPQSIELNGTNITPLGTQPDNWLDPFIKQCTGGVRDGNRIKWELPEASYFYDPIEEKLTMVEK